MSLRNMRKVYGDSTLLPPGDNSDEEYEPLYAKRSTSIFQGLILSSHSESEHESNEAVVIDNTASEEMPNKKRKKKKKKQQKVAQMPGSSSDFVELDEIDKSVMEVNAMLGTLPATSEPEEMPKPDPAQELLKCQHKHLNFTNELKKLFGPEALDEGGPRRGRQSQLNRLLKKAIIVPTANNMVFRNIGLSMSIQRRQDGLTYFTFDHSREYQRRHKTFLQLLNLRTNNTVLPFDDAYNNGSIESLIESADSMFRVEEYTTANNLVEQSIAYMQYVAHPSFNLAHSQTRLEYKYLENRPFHVAVLKYLHLLTNRACHRTALELAKLLLNLDPSDPLAVVFIIDTLALRAREHQWLIDAVDHWTRERDAGFLFNIQYSYAMAHFHVASKNKGDLSKADDLLQNAMLSFPTVVMKILECASATPSTLLQSHVLFNTISEETTSKNLKELIFLYAKFTWSKWREPTVFEWMKKNAHELAVKYDNDVQLQERARELANKRLNLFQDWPNEIARHVSIIKPMANLLVDGAVPNPPDTRSQAWDPVPPTGGINRYRYADDISTVAIGHSMLYELFSSILPDYEIENHGMYREVVQEIQNQAEIDPGAAAVVVEDDLNAPNANAEINNAYAMTIDALANIYRRLIFRLDGLSNGDTDNIGDESDPREVNPDSMNQESGSRQEESQDPNQHNEN